MMENMNNKGALKAPAKLFLNSLYGTMSTNTDSSFKVAYTKEDGFVGFNTITFEIRAALANYYSVNKAGFIYADTDSIHCDLKPEQIKQPYSHIGRKKQYEK